MTEKNNWSKPEIIHGKLTKYNYIVQYPEGLELGKNFDIGTGENISLIEVKKIVNEFHPNIDFDYVF